MGGAGPLRFLDLRTTALHTLISHVAMSSNVAPVHAGLAWHEALGFKPKESELDSFAEWAVFRCNPGFVSTEVT